MPSEYLLPAPPDAPDTDNPQCYVEYFVTGMEGMSLFAAMEHAKLRYIRFCESNGIQRLTRVKVDVIDRYQVPAHLIDARGEVPEDCLKVIRVWAHRGL